MSSRNLNPAQLKMFMTPREIATEYPQKETFVRSPEDIKGDPRAQTKIERAKLNGLADSIAKEGVKKPIDIMHDSMNPESQMVVNGHHRFSVALDTAPDRLIPVTHHDSFATVDWTGAGEDPTGDVPYRVAYGPANNRIGSDVERTPPPGSLL